MNRQCLCENKSLIITALLIFLSVPLFLIYGGDLLFDELEHLRASYLVSLGFHPYKDFFEHHHPTLWYLWAPLLKYLPHNQILLFYLSRILTTMFSLIGVYYIYQTARRFFGGKKTATCVLVIYFSFYFAQTMAVVFKPDAYMWSAYLCGLYHFFCYVDTKQQKHLCIASTAFAVSFIFLQTAAFLILPVALFSLYLIYKEASVLQKFIPAVIPALVLLSIFFALIHLTSGIIPYYQRNWVLNAHFGKFMEYSDLFLPKFLIFILIGYGAYIYQIKTRQATIYTHMMAFILTTDFIKNIIYLSPFPHYFQPEALAFAFLLAPMISQFPSIVKNYLTATLIIFNIFNIFTSLFVLPNKPYFEQINIIRKDKNARVYPAEIQIYTPYFPFYWFFPTVEMLDNTLFNKNKTLNMTDYIISNHIDYFMDETLNGQKFQLINKDTFSQFYELISDKPYKVYKRKADL